MVGTGKRDTSHKVKIFAALCPQFHPDYLKIWSRKLVAVMVVVQGEKIKRKAIGLFRILSVVCVEVV